MSKQNISNIASRTGQLVAIGIFVSWYYVIISEGVSSITGIAQSYPDDFWRNYFQLLLHNIGGY